MNDQTFRWALVMARVWVTLYTLGASGPARARRRAEMASDLWESVHADEQVGALTLLRRVFGGALDDLAWAIATRGLSERILTMSLAVRQIGIVRLIATLALGCVCVALAASLIGGASLATSVVLGALGIVGFTGLTLSLTDPSNATGTAGGAIVNDPHATNRRKRLVGLLLVSVLLIAVTAAYAFTHDEWGATGALIIVGILPIGLFAGLAALTLLISDGLKASRQS